MFPEATSQAFGTGRLDDNSEALDGSFASGVCANAERLNLVIVVGLFCAADTVQRGGKQINRVDNVALAKDGGAEVIAVPTSWHNSAGISGTRWC